MPCLVLVFSITLTAIVGTTLVHAWRTGSWSLGLTAGGVAAVMLLIGIHAVRTAEELEEPGPPSA